MDASSIRWVASLWRHQAQVTASGHVRPLRDGEREDTLAALGRTNGNPDADRRAARNRPRHALGTLKRHGHGPSSLLLVAEASARVVEFITSN